MANKKTLSARIGNLRPRAEEIVMKEETSAQEPLSPEQMQQMLHELRVHQIELKIQNEELRRTQQELESSRARYFELYDLAPIGYLTLNEQGQILEANLTAGTLLRLPRNTLLKQQLTRFFLPEDQDIYYLQRKHLFDSIAAQSWDMRMITSAGPTFWAHLQAIPALNGECLITLEDITERKQAEEALQKNENQYRTILHTLLDGFWVVDMQGRFIDVNEAYCKIIGYNRNELLEMSIQDVEALENKKDIEHRIQKVILYGSQRFESQHRCKDGHIVDLDICVSNLPNYARLCASLRDITENNQTENALRLANEEWLNTFNASTDPIMILDCNCCIRRANSAMAALLGMQIEECVGKFCYEQLHHTETPVPLCPHNQMLQDGRPHTGEIFEEHIGKHLLVTVSPLFDANGNLIGSMHYAKDISPLKEAEQVLANAKSDLERKVTERTSELAHANELMKKVSFELIWAEEKERERIAAELHDQVGQALLLAKMKLDALEDKLSDDSLHTYAMEAASLIGTSIQDIRSLTFRMRPPILDTAGIETALEWLCSSISNDYNLQVDFVDNCQPKPLLSAEVRYSLYQAVRELMLNVVKHAGTEKAQLSITCEKHLLVVQVVDKGIGFNHPDAIMKHVHNGGYGLFNVRQRIEQMDGRFAVESTPGQGTSVTLRVPLSES